MSALEEIVELARQQLRQQALVDDLESSLAAQKERLKEISEIDLPAAMAEAGMREFVLDTGEKITIKEDFVVGIPVERREEAYDWLTAHGYGGLIKTEVAVEFGKGDLKKAQALLLELSKKKYGAKLSRNVMWQTLKAFITEQTKTAKKVPMDLFGAIPMNKAIIKAPK